MYDIEVAFESPVVARAAMPGTLWALPQLPSTSLTTNASLTLPVVAATLGQSAGLIGAAALIFAADRYWAGG